MRHFVANERCSYSFFTMRWKSQPDETLRITASLLSSTQTHMPEQKPTFLHKSTYVIKALAIGGSASIDHQNCSRVLDSGFETCLLYQTAKTWVQNVMFVCSWPSRKTFSSLPSKLISIAFVRLPGFAIEQKHLGLGQVRHELGQWSATGEAWRREQQCVTTLHVHDTWQPSGVTCGLAKKHQLHAVLIRFHL